MELIAAALPLIWLINRQRKRMAALSLMPFPTKNNMRPSSYSFTPSFFHLTTTANDTPGPSRPTTHQQRQPVIYSPEKYGHNIEKFIRSRKFPVFKKEYENVLDSIAAFVQDRGNHLKPPLLVATKQTVTANFNSLKYRLLSLADDHGSEVYGIGKELFHALEDLLRNEKIPLSLRMDAVIALAPRTQVCIPGLLSDLHATIAKLKAYGGLKGTVHALKMKLLEELIIQYLRESNAAVFGDGTGIHAVNFHYSNIAPAMGLEARPDRNSNEFFEYLDEDDQNACKEFVFKKLDPMLLANAVSDEYLTRLEKSFHDNGIALDNIPLEKIHVLQNIQESELAPAYGEVTPHAFLEPLDPTDYDSAYAYTGARRPKGVVRHFLEEFTKQGWADKKNKIVLGDTGEGRIKMEEGLLWIKVKGDGPREPTVQDWLKIAPKELLDNLEKAEPTDAQARTSLLRAIGQCLHRSPEDSGGALEEWLRGVAGEMKARPSWLRDGATPLILLAAAFNKAFVLDALLAAGGNENAVDEDGRTALMLAAQNGHVAALEALLKAGADTEAWDKNGNSALLLAVQKGHADIIKAFGALPPETQKRILLGKLPPETRHGMTFNVPGSQGAHGWCMAIEKGHTDIIKAFWELLLRLPSEVRIEMLLNAKARQGTHWLCMAMQNGHADELNMSGELLLSLPSEERMQILLDAKDNQGNHWLCSSMQGGHGDVRKMLENLLLNLPLEERAQILLDAKDRHGTRLLYVAMLVCGDANVLELGEKLRSLSPEERMQILSDAKDSQGNHWLCVAMQGGDADVLRMSGNLLLNLPPEERKPILSNAKDSQGNHWLCSATGVGDNSFIETVVELLLRLPPGERIQILSDAKDRQGNHWLCLAMQDEHNKVLKMAGAQLLNLPPEERKRILSDAKDSQGNHWLHMAMERGNLQMVGKLLRRLPPEERTQMLVDAQGSRGTRWLYRAMQGGHADMLKILGELLLRLPEMVQRQILLNVKDDQGRHGLYMAMQNGHADVITVLGELLRHLPQEAQMQILLNAKDDQGTHGLYMAMERGHADIITVLGELLLRLPQEAQMQILLNAKNGQGTHGLYMAMEGGHANVIKVLGELLLRLPPAQCVELLAIKNSDGISGLAQLLKKENWRASGQYMEVVKKIAPHLDSEERAALLSEIQRSQPKKIFGWIKGDDYALLKKSNPYLHWQFMEMKKALSNK